MRLSLKQPHLEVNQRPSCFSYREFQENLILGREEKCYIGFHVEGENSPNFFVPLSSPNMEWKYSTLPYVSVQFLFFSHLYRNWGALQCTDSNSDKQCTKKCTTLMGNTLISVFVVVINASVSTLMEIDNNLISTLMYNTFASTLKDHTLATVLIYNVLI